MREHEKSLRRNRSGQLLIVAALAIALLISSTTVYVYEVSREPVTDESTQLPLYLPGLKQSTRNTVTSSLSNISKGGETATLETNLAELSDNMLSLDFGICSLAYTPLNESPYDSGIVLSWNKTDTNISGAYVNFTLNIYGINSRISTQYSVNITTTLLLASIAVNTDTVKHVNLTCIVANEDKPALAESFVVYCEESGIWTRIESSTVLKMDYGNGTYSLDFTVQLESTQFLLQMNDLRGIQVQAKCDIA